ncbi:hypothetical protein [Bradyrhizobium sp. SZCCHNRI3052]|uniref:hypothetical protein n=1 Tax=Bradyrhizobium sp. SZCCHNRI3052 TaxID=3057295 RepID=UPI002915D34D|nr:hypothetical protein [Bradyrhizobium sp. SZCCHNRI3052]
MSIIEKIVGLIPTVREKAKAVPDYPTSKEGQISLAVLLAITALGLAHHVGVSSQQGTIEQFKRELGSVKLQLAAAEQARANAPACPVLPAEQLASPPEPAPKTKAKMHAPQPAKRPASGGAHLSPADSRWLLDIR